MDDIAGQKIKTGGPIWMASNASRLSPAGTHSPEVEKVKDLIESKGGNYMGGRKFTGADLKTPADIETFAGDIEEKL